MTTEGRETATTETDSEGQHTVNIYTRNSYVYERIFGSSQLIQHKNNYSNNTENTETKERKQQMCVCIWSAGIEVESITSLL